MTRDRRDAAGGDGLLYIPDDDLVRSTVEGDDADWSDARSYVPSDALISSVLHASVREAPRFKFPDWYASPGSRNPDAPIRAASAILAALHLSPSILAAATVLHIVAVVVLGPLTLVGGNATATPHRVSSPVRSPRLVYLSPPRSQPVTRTVRRPVSVAVTANGFRVTKPDSTTAVTVPPADTLPATVDPRGRTEPAREDRELAAALVQEFRLGGEPLRVEAADRPRLEELARTLLARPLARLRVTGTGPPGADSALRARRGMREAEVIARELISRGVLRERIELYAAEGQSSCPATEPACAANRSRVRTSLAPSRP